MKFTCNREDLLNAINRAEKAVAAKPLAQGRELAAIIDTSEKPFTNIIPTNPL